MRQVSISACAVVLAASGSAAQTTLTTTATITYRNGTTTFRGWDIENEYWEYDLAEPGLGADDFLGRAQTSPAGVTGALTTQSSGEGGRLEFYGYLRTVGPWGRVRPWGGFGLPYQMVWPGPTSTVWVNTGSSASFPIAPTGVANDTGKAFQISQPIVFARHYFLNLMGGGGMNVNLAPVQVRFDSLPHFDLNTGLDRNAMPYYLPGARTINIDPGSWFDWDVILHEYGHHLMSQNGFASHVGGRHNFGIDNIKGGGGLPGRGVERGSKIAWSEGVATKLALMALDLGDVNSYFGGGLMAADRDRFYDDTNNPDGTGGFWIDIEGRGISTGNTTRGAGEGDELSVMRAVWDFRDGALGQNESFGGGRADRLYLGAPNTWRHVFKANDQGAGLGGAETFRDAWINLTSMLGADGGMARAGLPADTPLAQAISWAGETLVEYAIAHIPVLSGEVNDRTPTFTWTNQNNGNSDWYRVLVYSEDFSTLIFDSLTKREISESYRLPNANALALNSTYQWVVLNSPAWREGTPLEGPANTGDIYRWYWSQANTITIRPLMPGPGTMALGFLALPLAGRRRRS